MPLNIRGKVYYAPNDAGQPGILGKELVAIEDHFGLDAISLISVLDDPKPSPYPGYTKSKALYALAWICLTRGGVIVSIQDVLDDYSVEEFEEAEEVEPKKEVTALSEAEQESE